MKILVLSDCQSNGNNCLTHEVLEGEESTGLQTWSLKYHKKFSPAFKWVVKHIKTKGEKLPPSDTKNLQVFVWKYLRQQEMKLSWPALLNHDVINHSYNGAHFVGYLKRLNSVLKESVPDLIIVTDYAVTHQFVSFKHDGNRYYFEKTQYEDYDWDPDKYPKEVHDKLIKRLASQLHKDFEWHVRRHKKSYNLLMKKIKSTGIPYKVIQFGSGRTYKEDPFSEFMKSDINCIDLRSKYLFEDGEDSLAKRNLQLEISNRIQNLIL